MRDEVPPEVLDLARRRSAARREGDYATADALRAEIEGAGWRVVDHGFDFRLRPAIPPDREVDGRLVHGASAGVPSRLAEPPSSAATVVFAALEALDAVVAGVDALVDAATQRVQVVVAAVDGADGVGREPSGPVETVWLDRDVGLAGCWNAGIRRATGSVVLLVGPDGRVEGDVVGPVLAALDDESVAVAGARGLSSADLRRWSIADGDLAVALDADLLAFRRADAAARGPLDERFTTPRALAVWWSLVLRDAGPGERPRRAVALPLPVAGVLPGDDGAARNRPARRDFYRLLERFGGRADLLAPVTPTVAGRTVRPR